MVDARFGWLHLTDLHQGMENQGWMWPNVREELYRDLEELYQTCGPWDVVFFTGDLTQRGSIKEFKELDKTLADLWAKLDALGSRPVLIPVPGNHDLVRPAKLSATHRVLTAWQTQKAIHNELWDSKSEYRKALVEAFKPYQAWWQRRRRAVPEDWKLIKGILPGEFSLSIPCGSRRIGVVGLNSAFLQLAGGNFQGRLHLHPQQFHGACGGDGVGFARQHDACFLLTHHPPDWLDPDSQRYLRGEIAPPGRFVAHLYGHMHEQAQYATSEGGAEPRRFWQGPSLFGLEYHGDGQERRAHGYTAGCIEFAADSAELRLWPRNAVQRQDGTWGLGVDRSIKTLEGGGTKPESLSLRALPASQPIPVSTASGPIQRPGLRYDEAWHIIHAEEQTAIDTLQARQSVAVCAPLQFGKSWFVQRVSACLKQRDPALTVVRLDLNLADRDSLDIFLQSITEQIAHDIGRDVPPAWPGQGTLLHRFTRVLERDIKPHCKDHLLLILEFPDDLWEFEKRDEFFRIIRALAGHGNQDRWSWLTLFLAVSTAPSLYLEEIAGSPLNSLNIYLPEFSRDQIAELARRHGLAWGGQEIDALTAAVGGHPYLVRQVLYEAALSKEYSLSQSLDGPSIGSHLQQLKYLLNKPGTGLLRSLRSLIHGGAHADDHHAHRLEAAGIIRRDAAADRYVLRVPLYQRLL